VFAANLYSSSVRLIYFVAPQHNVAIMEGLSDARARIREVVYFRNLSDAAEREANAFKTEWQRYCSFFDDETQKGYSTWGRSLQLAYLFAKLGFYYAPRAHQSTLTKDKVRCAFCKRGKMSWWTWAYPETVTSIANRPRDVLIAAALQRWHRIKYPTCPAILNLKVDGSLFSHAQFKTVRLSVARARLPENSEALAKDRRLLAGGYTVMDTGPQDCNALVAVDPAPANPTNVNEDAQMEAVLSCEQADVNNVSESVWIHCCGQAVDAQYNHSVYHERVGYLYRSKLRYPQFISERSRLLTFSRNSSPASEQIYERFVSDDFYVLECLQQTGLELGTELWLLSKPNTRKMSAAGFFATLKADEVHCFACGGALSDWHILDDPFIEHAYYYPNCPFVLSERGQRFVDEVSERYDSRGSSSGRSLVDRLYSPWLGFLQATMRRADPRDVRARPEMSLNRSILHETSLNRTLFAFAIEAEIKRSGRDHRTNLDLIDAVRELECRMRLTNVAESHEFVRRCNEEYDLLMRGMHTSQRSQIEAHPAESTAQNRAPLTTTTTITNGSQHAQQHSQQPTSGETVHNVRVVDSHSNTRCAVCMDNPLEVAFIPCGHLSTCYVCGSHLDACPVCRSRIKGVVRVYM
jgi:hypothetical protein